MNLIKVFSVFIVVLSLNNKIISQENYKKKDSKIYNTIKNELNLYIDSLGNNVVNKFGYYVLNIVNYNFEKGCCSFSISYFLNAEEYQDVRPINYLLIDSTIVLVRSNVNSGQLFNDFGFQKIDVHMIKKLKEKFKKNNVWSYEPITGIYRYNNGKTDANYERIDLMVPSEFSIIDLPDMKLEYYSYPHNFSKDSTEKD